jgi:hypothetical protein
MSAIGELLERNRRELERAEDRAVRRMLTGYDQMIDRLESEIQLVARRVPGLGPERRAMWLESMQHGVRAEYAAWERRALGELDAVAGEGDRQGAAHAAQRARALGLMPVSVGAGRLNPHAAERLLGMLRPESPLRRVLSRYGPLGEQIIETELIAAIASGEGERQITRRIVRELRAPWLRSRLSATVRTELMRSYRSAQVDQYREMGPAVVGWRWTCARSLTTCLACIARDGTEYGLDVAFDQAHISCRCSASPIPAGTYDEAIRMADAYGTAGSWFAALPAHRQRQMMPSAAAWAAYRDGDLQLSDFVGTVHSPVWGTTVYQRSGIAALRAAGLR